MNQKRPVSEQRSRKVPKSRALGWSTSALLQLVVEGHQRKLLVAIAQAPFQMMWTVNALEIETKALEGISTDDIEGMTEAIYDAHAHLQLPAQRGIAEAIAIAERYAKRCGCKAIGQ